MAARGWPHGLLAVAVCLAALLAAGGGAAMAESSDAAPAAGTAASSALAPFVHPFPVTSVAVGVALFALSFVVCMAVCPMVFGDGFRNAERHMQLEFVSRVVSLGHNLLVVPLAAMNLLSPEVRADRVHGWTTGCEWMVIITLCFFLYDAVVVAVLIKDTRVGTIGMLLHHLCAAWGFAIGITTHSLSFYGCLCALTEVSTPLVGLRWFRRMLYGAKSRTTAFGLRLELSLIAVFTLCRLVNCPVVLYGMLWRDAAAVDALGPLVGPPIIFGTVVVLLLSTLWLLQLVSGLLRRTRGPASPSKRAS